MCTVALFITDSTNAGEPHQNPQGSIKHTYDFNDNQFIDKFQKRQEYQIINPELDVQSFGRIMEDPRQSVLKRNKRTPVYSTRGMLVSISVCNFV